MNIVQRTLAKVQKLQHFLYLKETLLPQNKTRFKIKKEYFQNFLTIFFLGIVLK
jgi:hypothetical protein